jgi:methylenetetrahydrofolate reductase (NADPH)
MSTPNVSFEFFPPNTEKMSATLWRSVERLAPLGPSFVSVTYGAGGSTRERTHETVERIVAETGLTAAAHLTCVAASQSEINDVADRYWEAGVRHIVALRGDMPESGQSYVPSPDGYAYAADLVAGLKKRHDFEVSVAAYPEKHPEAADYAAEIENLKRKRDAGASRAITQFFFNTDDFLRYRDMTRKAGLDIPLVPGVLPVTNFGAMTRFAARCGASVPEWVAERCDGLDDDPEIRTAVAAAIAAEQCTRLRQEGVDAFHFYTLNRAELTMAICRMLGVGLRT